MRLHTSQIHHTLKRPCIPILRISTWQVEVLAHDPTDQIPTIRRRILQFGCRLPARIAFERRSQRIRPQARARLRGGASCSLCIAQKLNAKGSLTMWTHMRHFTQLTNAFSKKFEDHCRMEALYAVWYNFIRIHKTLRLTPAMEAGVTGSTVQLRGAGWHCGRMVSEPERRRGLKRW
jgi:hypothetical protein